MDGYDVLFSILKSNNGEVRGRTAVQKLAYLAHCTNPELHVPQYEPYYYGPFSAELGQMLAELVDYGFVNEKRLVDGHLGYAYTLTREGERMSDEVATTHKREFDSVSKLVSDCKSECGLDIPVLSAASKIHYLVKTKGAMNLSEAINHAANLKWIIKEENATKGAALLKKLKLVD